MVLSWVNTRGVEVSAVDGTTMPAENNKQSLLPPGKWRAVSTYQGHLFHVRALGKDGAPGRLLLRHRAGMHFVKNPNNIPCDLPEGKSDTDYFKEREDTGCHTDCNFVNAGFLNKVGCGVDVYWRGGGPSAPRACERFSFHLGQESDMLDIEAWGSHAMYENTYNTHTFVARMAHNQAFVSSVKIEADVVGDCPDRGLGVPVKIGDGPPAVVGTTTYKYEPHCRANETLFTEAQQKAAHKARELGAKRRSMPNIIAGVGVMSVH